MNSNIDVVERFSDGKCTKYGVSMESFAFLSTTESVGHLEQSSKRSLAHQRGPREDAFRRFFQKILFVDLIRWLLSEDSLRGSIATYGAISRVNPKLVYQSLIRDSH